MIDRRECNFFFLSVTMDIYMIVHILNVLLFQSTYEVYLASMNQPCNNILSITHSKP